MRLDDLREQLEVDKANYENRKRRAIDVESKFPTKIFFRKQNFGF
jgi:hypothetical protein